MSATYRPISTAERERITRHVLLAPIEASHKVVGAAVGIGRSLTCMIRYGKAYADVLPDLPRLEPDQTRRRCDQCVHWIAERIRTRSETQEDVRRLGKCSLEIPEAENMRYARGCGAFTKAAQP
jgi:hypothetical protein